MDKLKALIDLRRSYADSETPEEIELESDPELEAALEVLDELEDGEGKTSYAAPGLTLAPSRSNPKVRRWIRATAIKHAAKRAAFNGIGAGAGGIVAGLPGAVVGSGVAALSEKLHGKAGHQAGYYEYWTKHHGEYVNQKAQEHGVSKKAVASALAAHSTAVLNHRLARAAKAQANGKGSVQVKDLHHTEVAETAKRAFERGLAKAAK